MLFKLHISSFPNKPQRLTRVQHLTRKKYSPIKIHITWLHLAGSMWVFRYVILCNAMPKYVQVFVTVMQLLFSFDQDMRVEKTLIQTLACQLSSTLIQLLFSFDQDMRVEKTLIQTLACQLSSTFMQLLFSFDQDMRVEKTLIQTLACQLSSTLMQLLFSFDQNMTY